MGRSRGALSTKVHHLCDGHGLALVVLIGAGHAHDAPVCEALMTRLRAPRAGRGRPRTRPSGATPYDFLRSTLVFNTGKISRHVTGDVLLLAGADDHFVPLSQLARQAANLTAARSVTTRTFTAAEHASNHCQVGNTALAGRVIMSWLDQTESTGRAERSAATVSSP